MTPEAGVPKRGLEKTKKDEDHVPDVTACKDRKATASEWEALALAYANVTRFTYEMRDVNGRSVLDTWNADDVS